MARQVLVPGGGYLNDYDDRQALVPGGGYLNESGATSVAAVASSAGTGVATGVGAALAGSTGSAVGTGAVAGVDAALASSVASAAGTSAVLGVGSFTQDVPVVVTPPSSTGGGGGGGFGTGRTYKRYKRRYVNAQVQIRRRLVELTASVDDVPPIIAAPVLRKIDLIREDVHVADSHAEAPIPDYAAALADLSGLAVELEGLRNVMTEIKARFAEDDDEDAFMLLAA